jgi:hypothetical protein
MRRALVALLVLAAGCDVVPPPTGVDLEPSLQLNAVLRAGADTVAVLLERTGTENGVVRTVPVTGAQLRFTGPGGEVALREAPSGFAACVRSFDPSTGIPANGPAGPGCYAGVVPGGVRAGASYSLAADVPGHAPATARTTVPLPPEPVYPVAGTRIPLRLTPGPGGSLLFTDALTLRWRTHRQGERVLPGVAAGRVYRGGRVVPGAQCGVYLRSDADLVVDGTGRQGFADSATVTGMVSECGEWTGTGASRRFTALQPDSVEVHLHLTALDSAYALSRVSFGGAVREASASVGVTGAYGMFVGLAPARRRIVLVAPGS